MPHNAVIFLAVFLACAVEMVEALTIVLAVGITRGWRSASWGVVAAVAALTALVAVFGPAIAKVPLGTLRLVVGSVLLIFGLQWLRKAILRASGLKDLHDEAAIFAREVEGLRSSRADWTGFTVAFKGVFLEGLEVAFLVVTFGASQHKIGLATVAAASAALIVAVVGVMVHRPLTKVPENTMKFGVGVMLTAFGIFWSAEGAGVRWPGRDGAIPALIAIVLATALAMVRLAAIDNDETRTGSMAE
jgi:uncharacterized membrane protein